MLVAAHKSLNGVANLTAKRPIVARSLEVNNHEIVVAVWSDDSVVVDDTALCVVPVVDDYVTRIEISVRDSGLAHLLDDLTKAEKLPRDVS